MKKSTPALDRAISEYPFAVQRAGRRGCELYDACMRKLTSEPNPMNENVANMVIMLNWDALLAHLEKDGQE